MNPAEGVAVGRLEAEDSVREAGGVEETLRPAARGAKLGCSVFSAGAFKDPGASRAAGWAPKLGVTWLRSCISPPLCGVVSSLGCPRWLG